MTTEYGYDYQLLVWILLPTTTFVGSGSVSDSLYSPPLIVMPLTVLSS